MLPQIRAYLEELSTHLYLDRRTEVRVVKELYSHMQEKMEDLERQGFSCLEAETETVCTFGGARKVARLLNEAYSQGSWIDALIAAQPHLILASLFATHFWSRPLALGGVFLLVALVTLTGWRHGRPAWLYPWSGVLLIPAAALVFAGRHLLLHVLLWLVGNGPEPAPLWLAVVVAAALGLASCLLLTMVGRSIRRDWAFASLALLPFPVLVLWGLHIERQGGLFAALAELQGPDTLLAGAFILFGAVSALFIRVSSRALKVGLLLVGCTFAALVAAQATWQGAGFQGLLLSAGLAVLTCLSPLLPETVLFGRFAHRQWLQLEEQLEPAKGESRP
jgi:hypothetical protein